MGEHHQTLGCDRARGYSESVVEPLVTAERRDIDASGAAAGSCAVRPFRGTSLLCCPHDPHQPGLHCIVPCFEQMSCCIDSPFSLAWVLQGFAALLHNPYGAGTAAKGVTGGEAVGAQGVGERQGLDGRRLCEGDRNHGLKLELAKGSSVAVFGKENCTFIWSNY